jgi:hypothetical protein
MSNKLGARKQREQIKHMLTSDPSDSWAMVELYRWQHGTLPPNDDTCKELDVSKGLMGMADAIMKGDESNFPTPFNVASVLAYAAKELNQNKK